MTVLNFGSTSGKDALDGDAPYAPHLSTQKCHESNNWMKTSILCKILTYTAFSLSPNKTLNQKPISG